MANKIDYPPAGSVLTYPEPEAPAMPANIAVDGEGISRRVTVTVEFTGPVPAEGRPLEDRVITFLSDVGDERDGWEIEITDVRAAAAPRVGPQPDGAMLVIDWVARSFELVTVSVPEGVTYPSPLVIQERNPGELGRYDRVVFLSKEIGWAAVEHIVKSGDRSALIIPRGSF